MNAELGGPPAIGEGLSQAFEHSITWEDDIWRADPVDVDAVHAKARKKFADLLAQISAPTGKAAKKRAIPAAAQARMLMFIGQSGAGKTHLLRALRTSSHRAETAYFGYAR